MTHVTCRLTAKNRDELRNPTLGNQVWAAFSFFIPCQSEASIGVLLRSVVKVDRRIRWHYTTTILRLRIGARLTRYEIVNFAISLALSAGTLMASAGTPYRLVPGMTKYRKGSQRTAKEHYGLSCRKLAPIELNCALYSSARQYFSHAAGLS